MSIYATLWKLKFPKGGDEYPGCEWIEVTAQGVPAHIGTPAPGLGYEDGDPYTDFLPPPLDTDSDGNAPFMRAVVFVSEYSIKGTERNGQEYMNPLLVMPGEEYAHITFVELHARLCKSLRQPCHWTHNVMNETAKQEEVSDNVELLSSEQLREVKRRLADAHNPVRYVVFSDIAGNGRWRLWLDVSSDAFGMSVHQATLFKREHVARAVAKAYSEGRGNDLLIAKITTKNGKRKILKYDKPE